VFFLVFNKEWDLKSRVVGLKLSMAVLILVIIVLSMLGFYVYTLVGMNGELEKRVANLSSNYALLSTRYEYLLNNYSSLKAEYTALNNRYDVLVSNYTSLKAQYNHISTLQGQITALQTDKARLEAENQILRQNITILLSELENLRREIWELRTSPSYWKAVAEILESQGKYAQALDAYQRIVDSTNASQDELFYAIRQIARLNKVVPPNYDPELANPYYAIVYIFKFVNVKLSDGRHVEYSLTEQEIQHIKNLFEDVSNRTFELTRGQIIMKYTFRIVDIPLTKVTEEGPNKVNWPMGEDPAVKWMFNDFKNSEAKYFNHFMVWYPKSPLVPAIPGGAGENHVGVAYYPSEWTDEFFIEVIIHEWLHSIDSMMVRIGYPDYLVPSPDGGRDEGYNGGDPQVDPDYRRPAGETTWYGYYRHIMQEHITPRMWRKLVTEYVRPP